MQREILIIVIQAMLKQVTEIMRYTPSASRRKKQRSIAAVLLLLLLALQACTPPASEQDYGQPSIGFSIYEFTYTNDDGNEEILTTAVWYPTLEEPSRYTYNNDSTSVIAFNAPPDRSRGPYPLIIFNHGAFASGIRCLPFTEHLASEGFIVASTDFMDTKPTDFVVQIALDRTRGQEGVISPQAVLDAVKDFTATMSDNRELCLSYLERFRLGKARFIIDSMLELDQDSSSPFYNLIDEYAIGMAGHSLGGLTTLGLIGKHPDNSMRDKRIKAAVVLSAPAYPFEGDYAGQTDIPIMVMHGDLDLPAIRPDVLRRVTYDQARPPKFYLIIKQCGHFGFSNMACKRYDSIPQCLSSDDQVKVITDYSSTFFRRYLMQDSEAEEKLLEKDRMLVIYEYELP